MPPYKVLVVGCMAGGFMAEVLVVGCETGGGHGSVAAWAPRRDLDMLTVGKKRG